MVTGPGIAAQRLSPAAAGLELPGNCAADGHEASCPGSRRIHMRFTGDRSTGRLPGVQLSGHPHAEIGKRIAVAATANFRRMTTSAVSDLDLSCTPPARGSWWDAVQIAAQAWVRAPGSPEPVPAAKENQCQPMTVGTARHPAGP